MKTEPVEAAAVAEVKTEPAEAEGEPVVPPPEPSLSPAEPNLSSTELYKQADQALPEPNISSPEIHKQAEQILLSVVKLTKLLHESNQGLLKYHVDTCDDMGLLHASPEIVPVSSEINKYVQTLVIIVLQSILVLRT